MNWNPLSHVAELDQIDLLSSNQPVLILKHSTSCSISSTALSRIERKWKAGDEDQIKPYYLDLIRYRNVSNEIESRYGVRHQSPQVLIIRDGKCIYNTSHLDISYEEIMASKV